MFGTKEIVWRLYTVYFLFSQGGFISLIVQFSWIGPAGAAYYAGMVSQQVGQIPTPSSSAVVNIWIDRLIDRSIHALAGAQTPKPT